MKRYCLIFFIFTVILFVNTYSNLFAQSLVLSEGEELTYVVYYGFIKLGEVKTNITHKNNVDGKEIYYSKSTMKSYSGVPLVSLNSTFESDMIFDGKNLYSIRFKAIEIKEDATVITEYRFNYDSDFVSIKKEVNGKTELKENVKINHNVKFQDGLSLLYCARINSFTEDNFLIPVFMNESETSVNYYFNSVKEKIDVESAGKEIRSVRCNGVANFKGVFGLSEDFAGWFSDDEARIPVKAQLNVLIGNITLELDSYKRKNWP